VAAHGSSRGGPLLSTAAPPLRPLPLILVLSVLAVLGAAAPAWAQGGGQGPQSGQPAPPQPEVPPTPRLVVDALENRRLVREGQPSRRLLAGRWYFRPDDTFVGERERWFAQRGLEGWAIVNMPHNWNAQDIALNKASVGWYRREFRLPRAPRGREIGWRVRFQGNNYRSEVWLNGRKIGSMTGYFPFELDLTGLRKGRNTLVVKVSSLRSNTDLTHWRPAAFNGFGSGGWWNFGGILREVYVRPVETIDIQQVRVLPRLRTPRSPAKVEVRMTLRNVTAMPQRRIALALAVGGRRLNERIELRRSLEPNQAREIRTSFTIDKPVLWQPGRPALYGLTASAAVDGRRVSSYRLEFGVRKLEARDDGTVLLNGRRLRLRGASIHEDDRIEGGALSPRTRTLLVNRLQDLGATVTRSHYPLHPGFLEQFDRAGILYWVQTPVYQLPNSFFARAGVRALSKRAARLTVENTSNHPSVFVYSLANEPAGNRGELGVIGGSLANYIRDASAEVRELDDTRFVAIDRQSRVGEPLTHPAYRHLDVLGVNEYFGWYDSYKADMQRPPTTTEELPAFLDQIHAANPTLPLFITEFGAEASKSGPETQPGTYEFQRKFVVDHLRIHASKRFVNGSIHWALRDFRVDPTWSGGAPPAWATPPWHNKSLIEETNYRKPVYFDMRSRWRKTKPLR
jgi:beta-galactosidase/beta-glucuronidase